jgi:hypothetical protein
MMHRTARNPEIGNACVDRLLISRVYNPHLAVLQIITMTRSRFWTDEVLRAHSGDFMLLAFVVSETARS